MRYAHSNFINNSFGNHPEKIQRSNLQNSISDVQIQVEDDGLLSAQFITKGNAIMAK
jgi:hypothetical protein